MSDPFIAEIRIFGGTFAPRGWAFCNGQLLSISQNTALFSLIGTYYGGDGRVTFGLPNLQARAPMGAGQAPGLTNRQLGETGGSETVTLTAGQMPPHTHTATALASLGGSNSPEGATWAEAGIGRAVEPLYADSPTVTMAPAALTSVGGNQPHNNLPPYLAVNFIIALQGIYPPRP